ncbi:MAG: hypothetical protein LC776_12405 [Acidobacteria bacterium]|nr:hypothetical protein [Acidobacteriota bacterium]
MLADSSVTTNAPSKLASPLTLPAHHQPNTAGALRIATACYSPPKCHCLSPRGHLNHSHGPSVDGMIFANRSVRPHGCARIGDWVGTSRRTKRGPTMDAEPVMQRDNEISRVAVDGRLVESGERCKFLAIHERTSHWAIYPHGVGKLGVRLPQADAVTVAHAILAGAQ